MQIAVSVPPEKADFMIEMLNNISFVKDISTSIGEKVVARMNLDDILKLRGKYAGDISVDSFLEQKRMDIELEDKI
jgi:hypothetical protein